VFYRSARLSPRTLPVLQPEPSIRAISTDLRSTRKCSRGLVYAIIDDSRSRHLLGDSIDVFVRREDAERFIAEVRGDDPELAKALRIEERELEAGGLN
jgi:hypothetical protein